MSSLSKLPLVISTLVISWQSSADDFLLARNSIGSLQLEKGSFVSVELIKQKFPDHNITYRIQSGDSPDFHYVIVRNKDGSVLFTIKSFFDESIDENSKEFDIDILISSSRDVVDEYGVRVGDSISKVIRTRGRDLNLYANHFDNSVGKDEIYYQFDIPMTAEEIENNLGVNYKNPEKVTLEEVITKNPTITSISWPRPRWE